MAQGLKSILDNITRQEQARHLDTASEQGRIRIYQQTIQELDRLLDDDHKRLKKSVLQVIVTDIGRIIAGIRGLEDMLRDSALILRNLREARSLLNTAYNGFPQDTRKAPGLSVFRWLDQARECLERAHRSF